MHLCLVAPSDACTRCSVVAMHRFNVAKCFIICYDILLLHWCMFFVRMTLNVGVILKVCSDLHIGWDALGSLCAVYMCYLEVHFCFVVFPFLFLA